MFEGDPIEFDDPNQRNLMAEVSTKVKQGQRVIINDSKYFACFLMGKATLSDEVNSMPKQANSRPSFFHC